MFWELNLSKDATGGFSWADQRMKEIPQQENILEIFVSGLILPVAANDDEWELKKK